MLRNARVRHWARIIVVALGLGMLSTAPASAVVATTSATQVNYEWVPGATVSLNGSTTQTVNVPANVNAVKVNVALDDERVLVSIYNSNVYQYDNQKVCDYVPFGSSDTCDDPDNYSYAYTRTASDSSTSVLKLVRQDLAGGGTTAYVYYAYAPEAPTINQIVRNVDNATATLNFTAPDNDSSTLAITDYEYNLNDGTGWQSIGFNTPAKGSGGNRTITISTFNTKNVYDVTMRAINANSSAARTDGETDAGGVISNIFNTGLTSAQIVGSVTTVPFAKESVGIAEFQINLQGVNIDDSADTTFALTQQPSGANASITATALSSTANGVVVAPNKVNVTTANYLGGDDYTGSSTVTVTLSNSGGLIAGKYAISATPSPVMAQLGARTQEVTFTVTARPTDAPRLASISTSAATANTGLVRDAQVVYVGARISDATAAAGTIRLRADLISFPTAGYVNVVAADGALNFSTNPTATASGTNNLVSYTNDVGFDGCTVSEAAPAAGASSGVCDHVTQSGTTGLASFTFTPTVAGSYVIRVWQDADNDGTMNVNEVRAERTITVSAYPAFSSQYSTSFINAVGVSNVTGVASKKAATQGALGDFLGDETILAPKGTVTAATFVKVAKVKVTLKDANGDALDSRSTFPVITATVTGPGTLAVDSDGSAAAPVGRSVSYTPTTLPTNAGGPEIFYVNVFNDGTAGASSIEIKVGSTVFATETLKFYGTVDKVTAATSNVRKVLPATAGTYGCFASVTACDSSTVAKTPAVKLVATDANGTPVPYRTYSAVSSADTTIAGISALTPATGVVVDETSGNSWFQVTVLSGTTVKSGATGTLTYSTNIGTALAPELISSEAVPFALGGAATTATLAISGGSNIGDKSTMTFTTKDAAGNASYDADHALALKSNIALTTAIGQLSATANALAVIGGTATIDFYNPLVAGEVSISGLIDGLIAVSASKSVSNGALDAAVDASAEAIDAANAATDAANLAAEAADAATVAAEEARDAADAATAAVEELASSFNTLAASVKAQITTLANTVAKIAKKVKAKK